MPELVLASSSPRRSELLRQCRIEFRMVAPDCSEEIDSGSALLGPTAITSMLAARKAQEVRDRLFGESPDAWVLGADTMVEVNGEVLGKPAGESDARRMTELLQGESHHVHTGLALIPAGKSRPFTRTVTTLVRIRALSAGEIDWYVATGEWEGAAGAYRIQERGGMLVDAVRGSYSNVVGLPLETFYGMLRDHGYPITGTQ